MADRKISDLTALTTPASGDFLPIVDISEAAAATKNKRITVEELMRGMPDGTAAAPGIAFENDPNTGIYSPGADQVAISTNGVQRAAVDSSGRVGIGTTAPNRKLEVSDASVDNFIRVNTTGATKSGIEFASGGTVYSQMYFNNVAPYDLSLLQQYTTGSLILGTNSTERARIDSSGKVGIGTTSPGATLHISGPVNVATANPVLKVVRNNNSGSVSGQPEIGIDVSIPNTFNDASAAYGVKVFTSHNQGGEHYAGYFEAAGSVYNTGIGVYAKTTHTDTNGNGYQPAVLADAYSTIGASNSGYAVALEARTNNYINNENIRVTSLYTGSSNQFAMRIIRNVTDIGGIRTNTTSTSYRTSTTAGFNGVDGNTLSFETSSLERARIDSSGRLLVGTPTSKQTNGAKLEIVGTRTSNGVYEIALHADSIHPLMTFSRGAALVSNGNGLGEIGFYGHDGTDKESEAARITAEVDGTPGANDMPGRLVFSTTADGAAFPTERMRIKSTGIINFSNAPTHADNTAATAAGLAVGDVYKTVLGVLMIRF